MPENSYKLLINKNLNYFDRGTTKRPRVKRETAGKTVMCDFGSEILVIREAVSKVIIQFANFKRWYININKRMSSCSLSVSFLVRVKAWFVTVSQWSTRNADRPTMNPYTEEGKVVTFHLAKRTSSWELGSRLLGNQLSVYDKIKTPVSMSLKHAARGVYKAVKSRDASEGQNNTQKWFIFILFLGHSNLIWPIWTGREFAAESSEEESVVCSHFFHPPNR